MTVQPPLPMTNIARVTSMKVLGVTLTNSLSVAEHVQAVISSCAQTLYALRILRAYGMDDSDLQTVYRSVVITKLTYASSAWWGFTSATDRQRLDAFIRRSEHSRLVPPNVPSFAQLCRTTDDRLFNKILSNKAHVLDNLLPPTSVASQNYNLRQRRHHLELPNNTNHLIDNNFI